MRDKKGGSIVNSLTRIGSIGRPISSRASLRAQASRESSVSSSLPPGSAM